MVESPPHLANGYVWFAHTLLGAERSATLVQGLRSVRDELQIRDVTALGDPRYQTEVELWVHPDDRAAAEAILRPLLADD